MGLRFTQLVLALHLKMNLSHDAKREIFYKDNTRITQSKKLVKVSEDWSPCIDILVIRAQVKIQR